jgi:hypothetical protein
MEPDAAPPLQAPTKGDATKKRRSRFIIIPA